MNSSIPKAYHSFQQGVHYTERALFHLNEDILAKELRDLQQYLGPFGKIINLTQGVDKELKKFNESLAEHQGSDPTLRNKLTRGESSSIVDYHPNSYQTQHGQASHNIVNRTISTADYPFQSSGATHSREATSAQVISRGNAIM